MPIFDFSNTYDPLKKFALNIILIVGLIYNLNAFEKHHYLFEQGYEAHVKNDFASAITNYRNFIQIENRKKNPRFFKIAQVQRSLASCYLKSGLLNAAEINYRQSAELFRNNAGNTNNIAGIMLQLAEVAQIKNQPNHAKEYIKQALSHYKQNQWDSQVEKCNFEIGKILLKQERFKEARPYLILRDSTELQKINNNKNYLEIEIALALAQIEEQLNNDSLQLYYLQKAVQFGEWYIKNQKWQYKPLSYAYLELGQYRAKKLENYLANDCFTKAREIALLYDDINLLTSTYLSEIKSIQQFNYKSNNKLSSLTQYLLDQYANLSSSSRFEIDLYIARNTSLFYPEHKEVEQSIIALDHYIKSINFINIKSIESLFRTDQIFINEQHWEIYYDAIYIALEIYEHTADVSYLEKAIFLQEQGTINQLSNQSFYKITTPKIINNINHLKELRSEIDQFQNRNNKKLLTKINEYTLIYDSLNPSLDTFKIENNLHFSIVDLQNKLTKNQIYHKYLLCHNKIYLITISNESHQIQSMVFDPSIFNHINQHKAFVSETQPYKQTLSDLQQYCRSSYNIYKVLFENHLKQNCENIVDLPIELNDIATNALTTSDFVPLNVSFQKVPFSIYTNHITQSNSILLWLQNHQSLTPQKINYLGIAPFHKKIAQTFLKGSIHEVKLGQTTLKGEVIKGKKNKIKHLLNIFKKYNVVHFATHSFSNSSSFYNSLEINDNKEQSLNYTNISKLDKAPALVIIGACNSGQGDFLQNLGFINLSSAFRIAGSKTIIKSDWNVNDYTSTHILGDFFKQIALGTSASKALQLAQQNYLQQKEGIELHPHFWAVYSSLGNNVGFKKIEKKVNYQLITIIIGLISICYWLIRSKRFRIASLFEK